MSRIALLVGAVPSRCKGGPIVRLLPGLWTMRIEHVIDSIIALGPHSPLVNGLKVQVTGPTDVQIEFVERGSEKFINVFAERVA